MLSFEIMVILDWTSPLIQQLIGFIFGIHVPNPILRPGLYSPNVLVTLPSLIMLIYMQFSQNHIKCSYFLISQQILFKFGIQIYYR